MYINCLMEAKNWYLIEGKSGDLITDLDRQKDVKKKSKMIIVSSLRIATYVWDENRSQWLIYYSHFANNWLNSSVLDFRLGGETKKNGKLNWVTNILLIQYVNV